MNLLVCRGRLARAATAALAAAIAGGVLSGCAPLLIGGAVIGSGLVVTDRRTTGIQFEDETIEFKAAARVRDLATLGHVNVTSYNRTALITGEVPSEADKAAVAAAVARVENVRTVANELVVGPNSSVGARTNDTLLGAKVKATLVDTKDVQANAFKVVTERGVVYLMGRVTEREAQRGAEIASSVSGVRKVVRIFEPLSDQDLGTFGRAVPPRAAAPVASAPIADAVLTPTAAPPTR